MSKPKLDEQIDELVAALQAAHADLDASTNSVDDTEPRRAVIAGALRGLRELAGSLDPAAPQGSAPPIKDGRYHGGNEELFIDLRVDEAVSGVISADLFRIGSSGRTYVASIRTRPGERIRLADAAWPLIGQDDLGGRVSSGRLSLVPDPHEASALSGALALEGPLNGLPSRTQIAFAATRVGDALRTIGIETENEEGVDPIAPFRYGARDVTVEDCFRDAGVEVVPIGVPSRVPAARLPWGTGQLHSLMTSIAQAPLTQRAWQLHLLLLSRSSRAELLGIMFDTTAMLPRQGAAVFAGAIRDLGDVDTVRKLIQTSAHELGHGLNLAHRFERGVGRADSLSFMNYDWRYRGGGRRAEFWERFAFAFDPDELEFLRHAPLGAVIPGGAPFHSINYWLEGSGGYGAVVTEAVLEGAMLELRAPGRGRVFDFGQPVFLEARLTNSGRAPLELPEEALDAKAGLLELRISPARRGVATPLAEADEFVPILQRCFDVSAERMMTLAPGESRSANLNLVYGCGGFAFAEPGAYDVTALLAIYDQPNEREFIARSNPLRIRVAHPASAEQERDALVLFDDEVGVYLALGGSDALPGAADRLRALRERREDVRDGVWASIVRAEGIDAGRWYMRYSDDRFRQVDGDPELAADLLSSLDDDALQSFDAVTARDTRELVDTHRKRVEDDRSS